MQRRSPCSFCEYCSGGTAASRYSPSFEKSHSDSIILRSQDNPAIYHTLIENMDLHQTLRCLLVPSSRFLFFSSVPLFSLDSFLFWPPFFVFFKKQKGRKKRVPRERGQVHFRRAAFSTQLKSRVGLALAKAATLRLTLNLDEVPITSKSHTTHHTRKLLVY
jgi:hypothetical protein